MLVDPEDYTHFARTVKRLILLDVLMKALERDRLYLKSSPCKMIGVWSLMLEKTAEWVRDEWIIQRKALRGFGGDILEVRQLADYREVKAKFRGYRYTQRYLNEWIRSECEDLLLQYWKVGRRTEVSAHRKNMEGENYHEMK